MESDFLTKDIEDCHEMYLDGNSIMLFVAIQRCAQYKILIPDWIRHELGRGLGRYTDGSVREFGEAFGITRPKGAHLPAIQMEKRFAYKAYTKVKEASKTGKPIDQILFDEIGVELGLSGSKVRDYYISAKRVLDDDPAKS